MIIRLKTFVGDRDSFWLFFGGFRGSFRLESLASPPVATSKASSFAVLLSDCYPGSLKRSFPSNLYPKGQ